MKTFLVSYRYNDAEWNAHIMAEDFADAEARLRQMGAWGKVDGELMATVPASLGLFARLAVWLRNLAHGAA